MVKPHKSIRTHLLYGRFHGAALPFTRMAASGALQHHVMRSDAVEAVEAVEAFGGCDLGPTSLQRGSKSDVSQNWFRNIWKVIMHSCSKPPRYISLTITTVTHYLGHFAGSTHIYAGKNQCVRRRFFQPFPPIRWRYPGFHTQKTGCGCSSLHMVSWSTFLSMENLLLKFWVNIG